MCDVFSRLYEDSTTRKAKVARKVRESVRIEEAEKWKLTLAANCYLVDKNPEPQMENPEVISSLSSISLHRKRPRSMVSKRRTSAVLSENRRTVSTIMDDRGSVVCTDNYIITDSVEPTPYNYIKPEEPMTPRRFYPSNAVQKSPRIDIEHYRQQFKTQKPKQVQWAPSNHITVTKLDVPPSPRPIMPQSPDHIILNSDQGEKLIAEHLKPAHLISSTGMCWEFLGYPTSLSYILEKK